MVVEDKQTVLLQSLSLYDNNADKFGLCTRCIQGDGPVSLRVLDWLVTNYAREYNVTLCDETEKSAFNIHHEYKAQLKAYSKRFFDPFCRRTRVQFNGLETTCGQLNFFRWAMQTGVFEYETHNKDAIEDNMTQASEQRKQLPFKKRRVLSRAAHETCTTTKFVVKVLLS